MLDRHLIRWRADGSTEWLSLGRDGAVIAGPQAGWPERAAERCIGILPADQVLLLESPRVAKSSAQLAKALPYAIEDAVVAPIETQHVAFAEPGSAESVSVAVVARHQLQTILDQAKQNGFALDAMYSEAQCLPYRAEQSCGLLEAGRATVRLGRCRALSLEQSAMSSWLDHAAATTTIHWFHADAERSDGERLTRPVLAWMAAHLPGKDSPNLLQGRFAPPARSAAWQAGWRWAAGVAAAAVLLAFGQLLIERSMLKRHVEERQAQMEQMLRQAVPDVQRIVDPVAQLRAALGAQGGSNDALALLGRLAPLLVGSSALQLEALEYRGGVMELTVFGPDVETLDTLRERILTVPGLQAELTAATPGSRGVEARLRISEVGG
ncbi:type II secretion system protein GspL [Pseudomarimonas arenosa]|uniref:Type II secretion system protein L n=1 Tax=Pseudomarimonas arenosa TaxID=2774145 RepID=A0AAW3ZHR6_9GAMM|nr:type II secretion system protein GspL [Pseudomarimonas arenosa]MBD8525556.1 hypothetical protein [Pseudomarimonas arenosa]